MTKYKIRTITFTRQQREDHIARQIAPGDDAKQRACKAWHVGHSHRKSALALKRPRFYDNGSDE